MKWLSKHDVSFSLLNRNGNLLSLNQPQETLNADLKIKPYDKNIGLQSKLFI